MSATAIPTAASLDGRSLHLDLVRGTALASAGAGWIHAAAAWTHGVAAPAEALFFVAVALMQLVWAAAILRHPSRRLLLAGLANVGVIALWAVSRTWGLPAGAHAGQVLPIGWSDGAAVLLGLAITCGALLLLLLRGGPAPAPAARGLRAFGVALLVPAYLAIGLSTAEGDVAHDHGSTTTSVLVDSTAGGHDH